jgi:hypothetical protein
VELVARNVEVGEVVVLFLDLQIAVRELAILFFDGSQADQHVVLLVLEPRDPLQELLAELLPLHAVLGGVVLAVLDLAQFPAKPLVLVKELLGELGSAVEERDELLGSPEDILPFLAHVEPFR